MHMNTIAWVRSVPELAHEYYSMHMNIIVMVGPGPVPTHPHVYYSLGEAGAGTCA